MGNTNMHEAKRNKNDEFYTRLTDIEKELKYYKPQFKNKIVYCNCDNPEYYNGLDKGSQFWKYFYLQFEHLGLKKLIATYYDDKETTFKYEYDGKEITKTELKGNGDFRNEENIEILKSIDIVVTNPPFSLYREFVTQLMKYKKHFLIVGNFNSVTYKEIFPLIKEEKIWVGYSPRSMTFIQKDGSEKQVNATWFTNLEVKRRQEPMLMFHSYKCNEKKYPKYDNYDAIDVSKVNNIPKDFEGIMGVPITFLTKHTPVQFEIVGLGNSRYNFTPNKIYKNPKKVTKKREIISGSAINNVLTLVTDKEPVGQVYYLGDNNEFIVPPYARVLIRNKKPEI